MVASMAHIGRRAALARLSGITVAALAAGTLAGCDKLGQVMGKQEGFRGIDITGADYGKGFSLHDANGQLRTLADFRGKVVQLYFGFTQCPDVCPTALTRAAEVKRLLGKDGDRFQVVFITVDPERDTPELLREYMAAFDPGFVALRPTPEELKQTAAEFKVYYKAVPTGSSYTMDHSAQSYLFDPQGRLRLVLRHEQTAQDYAHDVQMLLKQS
ncbi:MAG: SCO family protein [Burkholderiaceae bacterium]|nr:SCO family protein [Burkholderiaceae bacterium]HRW74224.1 SCO family protein [Ottowia sp.]